MHCAVLVMCRHTRYSITHVSDGSLMQSHADVRRGAALLVVVSVLPLPHALGGQPVPLQQTAVLIIVVQQVSHNSTK